MRTRTILRARASDRGHRHPRDAMALDGAATVAAPCDLGLCPPTVNQDAARGRTVLGELVPGQHQPPDRHRPPQRVSVWAGSGRRVSVRQRGRMPRQRDVPDRRHGVWPPTPQPGGVLHTPQRRRIHPHWFHRRAVTERSGEVGILGEMLRLADAFQPGVRIRVAESAACPRVFLFAPGWWGQGGPTA